MPAFTHGQSSSSWIAPTAGWKYLERPGHSGCIECFEWCRVEGRIHVHRHHEGQWHELGTVVGKRELARLMAPYLGEPTIPRISRRARRKRARVHQRSLPQQYRAAHRFQAA